MAKKIVAATAASPDETRQLRDAINTMDALSQEGFNRISSIARIAELALESPNAYSQAAAILEEIAHTLSAIRGIADDSVNCINSQAEEVGCNYIAEAERRRFAARRVATA